ncbi:hypothetical protein HK102_011805, partial [Quaeritorhiza haematococci]
MLTSPVEITDKTEKVIDLQCNDEFAHSNKKKKRRYFYASEPPNGYAADSQTEQEIFLALFSRDFLDKSAITLIPTIHPESPPHLSAAITERKCGRPKKHVAFSEVLAIPK